MVASTKFHKKSIKNARVGIFFVVLGISLTFLGAFKIVMSKVNPLAFEFSESNTSNLKGVDVPVHITIDSLRIDLPVVESSIRNGIWGVSSNSANHLDSSATMGASGNIVIYGHNLKVLFGPLPSINKGAVIKLTSKSGKEYLYKVIQTITVSPDNIEYVSPKGTEILTIYTCTGFLDSMRFVAVASPIMI